MRETSHRVPGGGAKSFVRDSAVLGANLFPLFLIRDIRVIRGHIHCTERAAR
jgi:hypothetical protein